MNALGRALIFFGIMAIVVGLLLVLGHKITWLGKLPGDICVEKKGITFFFPITTSILISVILSLIIIVLRRR